MDTRQHSDVTQSAPAAGGNALHWLALALTPGLGPTRTRKLAQHFGGIENVFRASLTELEAAGLPAHSAQSIATGGALVSEFAVGSFAAPQNFPIRNRIISGLAIRVLVIEAGEYSGTRTTARNALEQGRELFAGPGNVTNKNSWGPNTLIKQGAKLTATWEDVWEELAPPVKAQLAAEFGAAEEQPATGSLFGDSASLSPREKKVYALLKADEPVHIDELIVKLEGEMSSPEIFAILFELELAGKIKQLPGKNFVRTV
jgi:DNA processing protein